jgi:hypothetical protein
MMFVQSRANQIDAHYTPFAEGDLAQADASSIMVLYAEDSAMKDRGELGCALLLVGALIAGGIYLILQAPWLVLGVPLAIFVGILVLLVLADVFSDDVLVATEEPGGFAARRIAFINPIRQSLNKAPLLQVPKLRVTFEERQFVKQASQLATEIMKSTGSSPISEAERAQLRRQAVDVPVNMARALWRLDRLRRIRNAQNLRTEEGKARHDELGNMDRQVLAEIQNALATLSATPVNLMKLELTQAERPTDRLLSNLSETNQQLHDLSSAYDEVRGTQAHSS